MLSVHTTQFMPAFVDLIRSPPGSMIFLLLVSLAFALFSGLIGTLLIDTKQLRRYSRQVKEWRAAIKKAELQDDMKTIVRLRRKGKYIQKISAKMSKDRMKPLIFTIVPSIAFFLGISFSGIFSGVVTYFPANLEHIPFLGGMLGTKDPGLNLYGLYFIFWYGICSFTFSPIINRIFGLSGD
ncbi:MAG: EMC3/TMCO1 family protein [Promethearchaeota archaeon]